MKELLGQLITSEITEEATAELLSKFRKLVPEEDFTPPHLAPKGHKNSYTQKDLILAALAGTFVCWAFVVLGGGLPALGANQIALLFLNNLVAAKTSILVDKACNTMLTTQPSLQSRIALSSSPYEEQDSESQSIDLKPSLRSASGATIAYLGLALVGLPAASVIGGFAIFAAVAIGISEPKFSQTYTNTGCSQQYKP